MGKYIIYKKFKDCKNCFTCKHCKTYIGIEQMDGYEPIYKGLRVNEYCFAMCKKGHQSKVLEWWEQNGKCGAGEDKTEMPCYQPPFSWKILALKERIKTRFKK